MGFNISLFLCIVIVGISYYIDSRSSETFRKDCSKDFKRKPGKHSSGSSEEQDIDCPTYNNPKIDISVFNATNYRKYIEGAWCKLSPLSEKARALKDALISMIQLSDQRWNNVALGVTTLICTILPAIRLGHIPDLCTYAALINETVAAGNNSLSCNKTVGFIKDLFFFGSYMSQIVQKTSELNSGCGPGTIPKPLISCYKNGDACNVASLWKIKGGSFPSSLQCAAIDLSESCKYQDRFMGIITTAAILDPFTAYFGAVDKDIIAQFFTIQNVKKIDRRCCKKLTSDFDDTVSTGMALGQFAIYIAINFTGCSLF